jgi:hypothetical protein
MKRAAGLAGRGMQAPPARKRGPSCTLLAPKPGRIRALLPRGARASSLVAPGVGIPRPYRRLAHRGLAAPYQAFPVNLERIDAQEPAGLPVLLAPVQACPTCLPRTQPSRAARRRETRPRPSLACSASVLSPLSGSPILSRRCRQITEEPYMDLRDWAPTCVVRLEEPSAGSRSREAPGLGFDWPGSLEEVKALPPLRGLCSVGAVLRMLTHPATHCRPLRGHTGDAWRGVAKGHLVRRARPADWSILLNPRDVGGAENHR